jgi:FkbM family methyltransferase
VLRRRAVRAETDVGTLLLHADDRVMTPFIRSHGWWEREEAEWLRSVVRPGDVMVDCGANVGYFTLLGSRLVGPQGRVVALEPEPRNLALLRRNVRRHRLDNVAIVAAAAWNEPARLALRRNDLNAGDHQVRPEAGEEMVEAVALDDVLDGRADVVKIDTQGADHYVIAGLRRTLDANPGAQLLVEFWMDGMYERNLSAADVLAIYRELGRPIGLLEEGGRVVPASDEQVLETARSRPDHWVNLVLGPRP